MKIIRTRFIPLKGFRMMVVYGLMFVRMETELTDWDKELAKSITLGQFSDMTTILIAICLLDLIFSISPWCYLLSLLAPVVSKIDIIVTRFYDRLSHRFERKKRD